MEDTSGESDQFEEVNIYPYPLPASQFDVGDKDLVIIEAPLPGRRTCTSEVKKSRENRVSKKRWLILGTIIGVAFVAALCVGVVLRVSSAVDLQTSENSIPASEELGNAMAMDDDQASVGDEVEGGTGELERERQIPDGLTVQLLPDIPPLDASKAIH